VAQWVGVVAQLGGVVAQWVGVVAQLGGVVAQWVGVVAQSGGGVAQLGRCCGSAGRRSGSVGQGGGSEQRYGLSPKIWAPCRSMKQRRPENLLLLSLNTKGNGIERFGTTNVDGIKLYQTNRWNGTVSSHEVRSN
jgi:hypothetical protein